MKFALLTEAKFRLTFGGMRVWVNVGVMVGVDTKGGATGGVIVGVAVLIEGIKVDKAVIETVGVASANEIGDAIFRLQADNKTTSNSRFMTLQFGCKS